jgi:Domain of unknown function (DUF4115)/Helix-turn-helix domain
MEWERFDLLPSSGGHAREYLRSYAELLGLDAQPYVDHYDSALAHEHPREPARRRRRIVLITLVAVGSLAVVGLVAAWYLFRDESQEARAPAPDSRSRQQAASVGTKPTRTTAPARPATPVVKRKKVAPPTRVALAAVRGDSWIEARAGGAGGALLYRGNLARGRSIRLSGRRVWMRLGAASNLDVTLNGRRAGRSLFGTVEVIFAPRTTP